MQFFIEIVKHVSVLSYSVSREKNLIGPLMANEPLILDTGKVSVDPLYGAARNPLDPEDWTLTYGSK